MIKLGFWSLALAMFLGSSAALGDNATTRAGSVPTAPSAPPSQPAPASDSYPAAAPPATDGYPAAAPTFTPPSPQSAPVATPNPAPPVQAVQQVPAPPAGQWVNTSQYGWIWMPYDQAYTYVRSDIDASYTYVYYPAFGWRWVSSPWVFGFGPEPYWGFRGRVGFAWYAHPWFHVGPAYHRDVFRAHGFVRAPAGGHTFHGGGHGRR